jgi:hypothetical protein
MHLGALQGELRCIGMTGLLLCIGKQFSTNSPLTLPPSPRLPACLPAAACR